MRGFHSQENSLENIQSLLRAKCVMEGTKSRRRKLIEINRCAKRRQGKQRSLMRKMTVFLAVMDK